MVRKDSKGRTLKANESQRPDGRYQYKYSDGHGKFKYLYSWTLTNNDVPPKGKRQDLCLREKIQLLEKNIFDGIDVVSNLQRTTLNDWFLQYMNTKNLKQLTEENYRYVFELRVSPLLGNMKVSDIKYCHILELYRSLLTAGLSLGTVKNLQNILHPLFDEAVRNDIILKNPTNGAVKVAQQLCKTEKNEPRHALTFEQQTIFLDYVKSTSKFKHWLPVFVTMFGTGLRVGELLGLQWSDIDFQNNVISVTHNLTYGRDKNNRRHLSSPKTKSGIRTIPLLKAVKLRLLSLKAEQMKLGLFCVDVIDDFTDFIFLSRNGRVLIPGTINEAITRIVNSYNKKEEQNAIAEKREPVLLPRFTCHSIRHTFCSQFCEHETNLKVIQEIMGHSDIKTTMNIYSEVSERKKQESFSNFESSIKIMG